MEDVALNPGKYLVWPVPAMQLLGARFRNGRIMWAFRSGGWRKGRA